MGEFVHKIDVAEKHYCDCPAYSEKTLGTGSVWKCSCGQLYILTESYFTYSRYWKKLSPKKALKLFRKIRAKE